LGKYQEGLGRLRASMILEPRMREWSANASIMCLKTGNPKDAKEFAEEGIFWNPHDPILHFSLGNAHMALYDHNKAIDSLKESLKYNPSPAAMHKSRLRLKEEILRGDGLGTERMIYSNNAILDTVPIDRVFDRRLDSIAEFFPDIKKLDAEDHLPVRIVGGRTNKILEACLPLGNLVFGENVQAHCDIGIWMRSVGDPIIGELAFSYRVNNSNRGDTDAHKKANKFFRQLQLAIPEWLASGTTKTALIYGKPE
jgi:tetratricopeptide (TPR) repeat protein